MGTGVTRLEQALVWSAAGVCVAGAIAVALVEDVHWSWWQWAIVVVLVVDVAGGVPANALGTAKRFYHSTIPVDLNPFQRLLRHPVGFSAAHLHPFVVLLLPGGSLAWAAAWYLFILAGTFVVTASPVYLQRPVSAALATLALMGASSIAAPDGLAWLGPVLMLKLLVMHAVREEPYRPRRGAISTATH